MKSTKLTVALVLWSVVLMAADSAQAQDWPQWRGPNRDNKVVGFVPPKTWPKELTQKWRVTVGIGESSPVLVGDKLYLFARQGSDEVTLCLDAATGKEVWKNKYTAVTVTGGASKHPGTRGTPAVANGKVCTLGVGGVLSCLDAATGEVLWRKDAMSWSAFFSSYSPIIVDGKCIAYFGVMAKGGKGELAAFDLVTGEQKWKWTGDNSPHGSPVLMTIAGTQQLVSPTNKSMVGIDPANGKLLWQVEFATQYNSFTPIVDGQTLYCSGPQGGTVAVKIDKEGDAFVAKELWKKSFSSLQFNSPVLKDGALYGLSAKKNFYCMDAKTGDLLWTGDKADKTARGDCGAVLDAGSVLLGLTSDTYFVVFEPNKMEYKEIAKYKVADNAGPNTLDGPWAYPIIAGNRVYVKDKSTLTLWTID